MDYSMGPVETRVLKKGQRGRRGGQNDAMVLPPLIAEEEGHKSRNVK